MKFQLLIKTKIPTTALSLSDVVFIVLFNVKMPTILTFMSMIDFSLMSMINFLLSLVEHEKSFIT